MRKILGLVGATLLFAGPALAADLAVKAPLMPGPVLGWTGFYIGGNVGWGWSDESVNFSGSPGMLRLIAAGIEPSSLADRPQGPLGGIQVGYNWQTGAFLLGIEADIDAADIAKNDTLNTVGRTGLPWITTASQTLGFLGTVRGRLGYTITPTLLIYGTGGFAYGGAEVSTSVDTVPSCVAVVCGRLTSSSTLTGWTAGGGLEYMISPNWTAKLEYLHYDLGDLSQTYGDSHFPGAFVSTSTAFKGEVVRIGANYKF